MLLNYCATAGCHGPSSQSQFTLSRASFGEVCFAAADERNLYNTLQWIDHDSPIDSKLLAGGQGAPRSESSVRGTALGTTKYQELVSWVIQASPELQFRSIQTAGRGGFGRSPARQGCRRNDAGARISFAGHECL